MTLRCVVEDALHALQSQGVAVRRHRGRTGCTCARPEDRLCAENVALKLVAAASEAYEGTPSKSTATKYLLIDHALYSSGDSCNPKVRSGNGAACTQRLFV